MNAQDAAQNDTLRRKINAGGEELNMDTMRPLYFHNGRYWVTSAAIDKPHYAGGDFSQALAHWRREEK